MTEPTSQAADIIATTLLCLAARKQELFIFWLCRVALPQPADQACLLGATQSCLATQCGRGIGAGRCRQACMFAALQLANGWCKPFKGAVLGSRATMQLVHQLLQQHSQSRWPCDHSALQHIWPDVFRSGISAQGSCQKAQCRLEAATCPEMFQHFSLRPFKYDLAASDMMLLLMVIVQVL